VGPLALLLALFVARYCRSRLLILLSLDTDLLCTVRDPHYRPAQSMKRIAHRPKEAPFPNDSLSSYNLPYIVRISGMMHARNTCLLGILTQSTGLG